MIYKELAVEPEAIEDWKDLRQLLSYLGFAQGWQLSKFPKKWKLQVYESLKARLAEQPDLFTKAELYLGKFDDYQFVSAGRSYQPEDSWVRNAANSHRENPFGCVLTKKEPGNADFFQFHGSEADEYLKGGHVAKIPRTKEALSLAAAPLLAPSVEIMFVDQHFNSIADHGPVFSELVKVACSGNEPTFIQYHVVKKGDKAFFCSLMEKQCRYLPEDQEVIFVRWNVQDQGENFHSRYVLSELGGLAYDYGLGTGSSESETTDLYTLPQTFSSQRMSQLLVGNANAAYDFEDAWSLSKTGVQPVRQSDARFRELGILKM